MKTFFKHFLTILLIGIIALGIIILIFGCGTTKYVVSETSPIEDVVEHNTLYQMARFDTATIIPRKRLRGNTMIICLQDSSAVVIEGRKCEYRKNEMLYYIAERWFSPGFPGSHCKYILTNEEQTIKYILLDQD